MQYIMFSEDIPQQYEDVSLFELGPALYEGAIVCGREEAEDLKKFFRLESLPRFTEEGVCPDFKGGDVLYIVRKRQKAGYSTYQFFKTYSLD